MPWNRLANVRTHYPSLLYYYNININNRGEIVKEILESEHAQVYLISLFHIHKEFTVCQIKHHKLASHSSMQEYFTVCPYWIDGKQQWILTYYCSDYFLSNFFYKTFMLYMPTIPYLDKCIHEYPSAFKYTLLAALISCWDNNIEK